MKALEKKLDKEKVIPNRKLKKEDFLIENPEGNQMLHNSGYLKGYNKLLEIKHKRVKRGKVEKMLYLSLGLCISLLLIIGAFEYKSYEDSSEVNLAKTVHNFEDLINAPQTEQPPPPPPKIEQPQIIEVPDETIIEQEIEINLDVEITEETVIEEQVLVEVSGEMEEETVDEIFTIVEQQPTPQGGMQAFYQYVGENLNYPSMAARLDVQGRVFVQFVVEKDGRLTDIQVVKGIGAGCDEEAIRVLTGAPSWVPGKQRGRPVRVRMILPIVFKLVE